MKKSIYFIPGQGSDKRIFDSLTLDKSYNLKYLEYETPDKKITLKEFAKQISTSIDTTEEYVLIGVSLGGMICSEINEILNPKKVIIISSAKNRNELPFRYKFQRIIPLFEIFPAIVLLGGAKIAQPLFEPDRNKNKGTFIKMLYSKDPKYIKRTIRLIIKWKRTSNSKNIIHIHGTNDHTIPIRNIKELDYIVENGSHMMTLTRADEISAVLNEILDD
ncbi:alpha/beta hydrolase [Bacteroidota bacterium]